MNALQKNVIKSKSHCFGLEDILCPNGAGAGTQRNRSLHSSRIWYSSMPAREGQLGLSSAHCADHPASACRCHNEFSATKPKSQLMYAMVTSVKTCTKQIDCKERTNNRPIEIGTNQDTHIYTYSHNAKPTRKRFRYVNSSLIEGFHKDYINLCEVKSVALIGQTRYTCRRHDTHKHEKCTADRLESSKIRMVAEPRIPFP